MGLRVGSETPWGRAENVHEIGKGIVEFSTSSHGGLWVPDELLPFIPKRFREYAAKWSHGMGWQWFEEDCAWACLCVCFPDLFPADHLATARKIVERYVDEPAAVPA